MTVSSHAFSANGTVPPKHADYGEKISPDLSWTGTPASAKSVVLMVEDPDAKEPKPFVHWVTYNLPPSLTALPESIPNTPRLPEFGGALQGRNSRGTTGYFGPRPPGATLRTTTISNSLPSIRCCSSIPAQLRRLCSPR
jgi:Raf kinase inhibitor-like YbhB/YbcL family protein